MPPQCSLARAKTRTSRGSRNRARSSRSHGSSDSSSNSISNNHNNNNNKNNNDNNNNNNNSIDDSNNDDTTKSRLSGRPLRVAFGYVLTHANSGGCMHGSFRGWRKTKSRVKSRQLWKPVRALPPNLSCRLRVLEPPRLSA